MAEWLRRQPAKLMGFARVGSNPTVVVFLVSLTIYFSLREQNRFVFGKMAPENTGIFGAGFRLLIASVARSADIRSIIALPLCHAFWL